MQESGTLQGNALSKAIARCRDLGVKFFKRQERDTRSVALLGHRTLGKSRINSDRSQLDKSAIIFTCEFSTHDEGSGVLQVGDRIQGMLSVLFGA